MACWTLGIIGNSDSDTVSMKVRNVSGQTTAPALSACMPFMAKRKGHYDNNSETAETQPIYYLVEADIKGFFGNVEQEQLMFVISHRIADKRMLKLINRFLKVGIQEDGQHKASEPGTP